MLLLIVANFFGKLVLFSFILILGGCTTSETIRYGVPVRQDNLHKTVYIEDNLSAWQVVEAVDALIKWEAATHDMAQFDIRFHTSISEEATITDICHSLIIRNTTSVNKEIAAADSPKDHLLIVGIYTKTEYNIPMIMLVDDRLDMSLYETTLLHELGHSFGLFHEDDSNSIMYFNVSQGAGKITDIDMNQFCELYTCNY
jgi:hypothetical protein